LAKTNNSGEYALEGVLFFGDQELKVGRSGVDRLTLNASVTGPETGPVSIVISDPQTGTKYAEVNQPAPMDITTVIDVALSDIRLIVHKIRGTVCWPDSRVFNNQNYRGTPLAGKRVYALPLNEGDISLQRPSSTRAWEALKDRQDVHGSGKPGRFIHGERTDHSGAFEIKFIDLSLGRRYLVWIQSLDPTTTAESPEYTVRTIYRPLRELTNSLGNAFTTVGRHLIDHTYNLTADAIKWGLESIKVVNWTLGTGETEVRAVRPQRTAKAAYDSQDAAGERLDFDATSKILSDYRILCLPLVPIFEAFDQQSDHARVAHLGLLEAMDIRFPQGHFSNQVQFALDTRRIDSAINLQDGVWDAAWDPGNVSASEQRRRCELLEKTFLVSPQIPGNYVRRIDDAHWRFDAVTLADYALISIPIPPPRNRAVVANRKLDADWVPVLQPVIPRLTALSAGRHIFLAPGHGFYARPPASVNLANWRSPRGGYNLRAGEDENDGYLAAEVGRIVAQQGMQVSSVREIQDFTKPGVLHTANDTFNPSNNPDFLRLWQQNPVYYVGQLEAAAIANGTLAAANAVVIGTARGRISGNKNSHGIGTRWRLARQLAGGANPIDIFLAIHTNADAGAGAARGVSTFYLDVNIAEGNNTEFNTMGRDFATSLRDQVVNHCHLHQRRVMSLRQHGGSGNADLERTFDYWRRNIGGSSPAWPRVRNAPANPAVWQHRVFPRTIPVALVEVGFHNNAQDAALLSRAWFRRLAGEAMSFAVEEQLRANNAAVTRADMVRLLQRTFGPTASIQALASDNNGMTANGIRDYTQSATGEIVNVAASNLGAAATAIETARDRYTRRILVEALRDAFAEVAGYSTGDATEIERYITPCILSGGGIAALRRPDRPILRTEVATFIALAMVWSPANLRTVIGQQIDGITLMQQLNGADHPDKYLPGTEARELMTRIRTIDPVRLCSIIDLYIADEDHRKLGENAGERRKYTIHKESRIRLVAEMKGIPWKVDLSKTVQFSISKNSEFSQNLPGGERTSKRLSSAIWTASLPANGNYKISVSINHATQTNRTLKAEKQAQISIV
jgi:hypothetical protein